MKVGEGIGKVQDSLRLVTKLGVEDWRKRGSNAVWDVRVGFCLSVFRVVR